MLRLLLGLFGMLESYSRLRLMPDFFGMLESYTKLNLELVENLIEQWSFTRLENLTHVNENYHANMLQCYVNGSEQDQRRKQRQREIFRQCKTIASFRGNRKCYTIKQFQSF